MTDLINGFYILGGFLIVGFIYFVIADHFDK